MFLILMIRHQTDYKFNLMYGSVPVNQKWKWNLVLRLSSASFSSFDSLISDALI